MAYTLYTDRTELFECDIKLQGAKLKDSKVRLVLESDTHNLMFYGEIDQNGKCKILVSKLKHLIEESEDNNIKLEVIADDTFFIPWSDKLTVKASKQVTVEIKEQNKKRITEKVKKVEVKNVNIEDENEHLIPLLEQIKNMNLTYKDIIKEKKQVFPIITNYLKSIGIDDIKGELKRFLILIKK